MSASDVAQAPNALFEHRVLVCAGCGGVGKTSVAAALAVAAARRGLRVLALTVDPAGRLADSLGVQRREVAHQPIAPEHLRQLGIQTGTLSVAILDSQRTLLELVEKLAPSPERRQAILDHPLFAYLSDYLAGTNEFMAMEKLLSTLQSEDYDLIVLDTPPTRHALDFLEAPARLQAAVGGPIFKALVRAVDESRRFSLDWVSRGISSLLRSMSRLTGAGTLEQIATLLAELSAIFGGLGERANRVAEAFLDPRFAFVLVGRPDAGAIVDAQYFDERLRSRGMRAALFVVNRCHEVPAPEAAQRGLAELSEHVDAELMEPIGAALSARQELVARERAELAALSGEVALASCPRVSLPALSGGVYQLGHLSLLADALESAAP